jgi:hypothetical protein
MSAEPVKARNWMNSAQQLLGLARKLASADPNFLSTKGPGIGNKATNRFMSELRGLAKATFGDEFAEQKICGSSGLCVDYYFPHEETVVEIALGLNKPKTEFEKDILKVIMAREAGHPITRLIFICKPGGLKKCAQPGRRDVIAWLGSKHNVQTEIHELGEFRGGA